MYKVGIILTMRLGLKAGLGFKPVLDIIIPKRANAWTLDDRVVFVHLI